MAACTRDSFLEYLANKLETEDPFVKEARESFESEYSLTDVNKLSSSANNKIGLVEKIKLTPAWQLSKNANTKVYNAIEVPIAKSKNRIALYNFDNIKSDKKSDKIRVQNSFNRLLFYKSRSGRKINLILTYIPDYDYLESNSGSYFRKNIQLKSIRTKRFSGYIEYKRLDGRKLFVFQLKNGKVEKRKVFLQDKQQLAESSNVSSVKNSVTAVKANIPKAIPSAKNILMAGIGEQECEECTPIYQQACLGDVEEGSEDEVCSDWVEIGEECFAVDCPPDGTDPYPPCYPDCEDPCDDPDQFYLCNPENPYPPENEIYDCNGDLFGTAYNGPCGCMGGNTGIYECPEDPCDEVKALNSKAFFNTFMSNLRTSTNANFEAAYSFKMDGSFNYAQGANGQHFVSMGVTNPIDGYIHNHFFGGIPNFSDGDIELLKVLYDNNKINNADVFTLGVTTNQGTEYLLKISNQNQFSSFMSNLNDAAYFNNWSDSYFNNAQNYQTINGMSEVNAYERSFLESIQGTGMQLFKKDFSNGNYDPIKVSNGAIIPDPC